MEFVPVERPPQSGEIAAAEDLRQGADGEEEAGPRRYPARAVRRQRAAGHDAVHVHVLGESLPPGVEHGGHAEVAPEVPRIAPEGHERGGRALKQQPIDQARVTLGERVEDVGQGEDDVEVRNRQHLSAARREPALGGHALALGTVPIATGVVGDALGAALRADGPMAAERGGAAPRDGKQGTALSAGQDVGGPIPCAMRAHDVGQLKPRPALGDRARGAGRRAIHASAQRGGSRRSSGEPVASARAWLKWK